MISPKTACLLAAALTLAGAPGYASARGGAHVEGVNQTSRIDCRGGPAHVEGTDNRLTFTGNCSSLKIEGVDNRVTVELAPGASIRVEGASNRVKWTMADDAHPRISVEGVDNKVERDR